MKIKSLELWLAVLLAGGFAIAALVVPNEIQQPGTQPGQAANLETPDKCDNCHGGYNNAVEPAFNWRGSMMANAGRDPIFWATVAIVEQDFDGAGDLCIRCHSTAGWIGGRSTPTDGSGLTAADSDGVDCDTCHKMTNPDNSEHLGTMIAPFIANNEGTPAIGYYGSGMLSLWAGAEKLGPYSDPAARHQFLQSRFHRSTDFCGSCHDVSNPAVGDLAHNNGAQLPLGTGSYSGVLGSPVTNKAAFNNFPYQYGIVERTFSEYKSGLLSQFLVSNYAALPAELKAGAIKRAYDHAQGNYADGAARYFSCQTCHLRATNGLGCNKAGAPVRPDLPLHDMTGGNYWMPDAIIYQNANNMLRLGGGLTLIQSNALVVGKGRAQLQLSGAASLSVSGMTVRVVNLTGHKLISGYPEGRRMWLRTRWYDAATNLVREDGAYKPITVYIDGAPTQVWTIADLHDPHTKIYEAHYGMTKEWASQLLSLGYPSSFPIGFDRVTGTVSCTLGDIAAQPTGTYHESFHFVLNNHVAKDNRIPPYGMRYDVARLRNALPVPANQYGSPATNGVYRYWDEFTLDPPAQAASARVELLYQPTSWEYVQFLYLANNGSKPFLAAEGTNMLKAWLNTGMAAPFVMAATTATFVVVPKAHVDITNPVASIAVPFAIASYRLAGTNNAATVGTITWTNLAGGAGSMAAASTGWSFSVSLAQGANVIAVRGTNALGTTSADTVTITRIAAPFIDITNAPAFDIIGGTATIGGTNNAYAVGSIWYSSSTGSVTTFSGAQTATTPWTIAISNLVLAATNHVVVTVSNVLGEIAADTASIYRIVPVYPSDVEQFVIGRGPDYGQVQLSWSNGPVTVLACTNRSYMTNMAYWFILTNNVATPWTHTAASNYPSIYYRIAIGPYTSLYDVGKFDVQVAAGSIAWLAFPFDVQPDCSLLSEWFGRQLNARPYSSYTFPTLQRQTSPGGTIQFSDYYIDDMGGGTTNWFPDSTIAADAGYVLFLPSTHGAFTLSGLGMVRTNAFVMHLPYDSLPWLGLPYPASVGMMASGVADLLVPAMLYSSFNYDHLSSQQTPGGPVIHAEYYIDNWGSGTTNFFPSAPGADIFDPGKAYLLFFSTDRTGTGVWSCTKPY